MTFLTELARLKAAATKGPWRYDGTCALKGPQLETTSLHGQVVRYRDTLAQFVASKSGNENANLTAYLRNHADAIEALVKAAEGVLTGGNHLALLIGNHPPAGTDIEVVQRHYLPHHQKMYEAWCCWNTIMRLRDALAALDAAGKGKA